MGFDISTAKPVNSQGFDLSSAEPIEGNENAGINNNNNDGGLGSAGNAVAGVVEPVATIVTGAVAEPVSGLAGIGAGVLDNLAEGLEKQGFSDAANFVRLNKTPTEIVEGAQEALTFQPRTDAGQEGLQAVGDFLAPVGEAFSAAETALGDAAFEATGSPALAAAATAIPTLATEVLGIGLSKGGVKSVAKIKASRANGNIARSVENALPSIDQLKDTSRALFKEIDESGAVLKSGNYQNLVNRIDRIGATNGLDSDITPKAEKVLRRMKELSGEKVSLTELDNLRSVAQKAAGSIDKADASLGVQFINEIDDFLDSSTSKSFVGVKPEDLSVKYKTARDLWGRARRAEVLGDAFEKARNQASGFENGVVTQFRSIINNKKTSKLFQKQELDAMKRVVRGSKTENMAKLIGRLGFSEGKATNILGGSLGVAGGAAVGGPIGAVAVPLVGQVSRNLAQRMTVNNAMFADQVIRAGKDAKKIAQAYNRNTPKAERSAAELSELLMSKDIDISKIDGSPLSREAAAIANETRAALEGVAGAGVTLQSIDEQER